MGWAVTTVAGRVKSLDWETLEADLFGFGVARTTPVLSAAECASLIALYGDRKRFRKRVHMERHRFGAGEYGYFAEPLPKIVSALRRSLYVRLAPIANRVEEALGESERYPSSLAQYRAKCAAAGQSQPTPLLLRYVEGGYNRLHRDLYGALCFPLQATVMLSSRHDYGGGEFLIVENQPRQQSRAEVLNLELGEMVVFFCAERPVPGARSTLRAQVRHGVSRLRWGQRHALGVIFHDAAQ